jgi:hypothetical protein
MSAGGRRPLTFAILDSEKGIPELPPATGQEYPLPTWYRAVREIPIEELEPEDICKACRQQIHIGHVVPIALRVLQSEPLAGEMYDGELLASLKSIPPDYWPAHKPEATVLRAICEGVRGVVNLSDDVRQDVAELLTRVTISHSG